jgi:hypothetical protein
MPADVRGTSPGRGHGRGPPHHVQPTRCLSPVQLTSMGVAPLLIEHPGWKRSRQTAGRRSSRARGVLKLRSLPKALPPGLGAVEGSRLPRPSTRGSSRSLPVSPPVGDSLRGWGGPLLGSESGWARNPSTPRLATLLPGTGPRRPLAAHEAVGTCGICRPYGRLAPPLS